MYFAFAAGDELQNNSILLLNHFDQCDPAPQDALFIKVASAFADVVIQNLLLNMVHNMEGESRAARILDKLAGIIKGTVHVLVKQTLHKKTNEELLPLVNFVRAGRLVVQVEGQDKDFVCFPMPLDLADHFAKIFHHVDKGDVESQRQPLRDAMLRFSELAHFHFYDEPTQIMNLGFIARKAVALGSSTIKSGSRSSITQIFPQLSKQEIIDFVTYFRPMFIEADD